MTLINAMNLILEFIIHLWTSDKNFIEKTGNINRKPNNTWYAQKARKDGTNYRTDTCSGKLSETFNIKTDVRQGCAL